MKLFRLFCLLLATFIVSGIPAVEASGAVAGKGPDGWLKKTVDAIQTLPRCTHLDSSEIQNQFYDLPSGGEGLVFPNSANRNKVMEIVHTMIPPEYLYSISYTDSEDINLCFISPGQDNSASMLMGIVGTGTEDILLIYYEKGDLGEFRQIGDGLKQYDYAILEESVAKANAECPMVIGPLSEITSISVNHDYWTCRFKIDTLGNGLNKTKSQAEMHDIALNMLACFQKSELCEIFNVGLSFRFVMTIETGESMTIIFGRDELASVLTDLSENTLQMLGQYVDNQKSMCPQRLTDEMTMTDIFIGNGYLTSVLTVDEDYISLENLRANLDVSKQSVSDIYRKGQDLQSILIAGWLVKAGMGIVYRYVGDVTGDSVDLVFTADELADLIAE